MEPNDTAAPVCAECGHDIDPDWCWCGTAIAEHYITGGCYSPRPMGCMCGYASSTDTETPDAR